MYDDLKKEYDKYKKEFNQNETNEKIKDFDDLLNQLKKAMSRDSDFAKSIEYMTNMIKENPLVTSELSKQIAKACKNVGISAVRTYTNHIIHSVENAER